MTMLTLQNIARSVLPLALTLVLCGHAADGAVVQNSGDGGDGSAEKGPEMLYGFPLTLRLNIGLVATIDPVMGEFKSVSTGLVPFFANSAAVAWKAQFLYVSNSYINGLPYNGSQIISYS